MKVKFVALNRINAPLQEKIDVEVKKIMRQGDFILGNSVDSFEKRFADFCEVKYAIGVGSGHDALELILRASNIGNGDEVIIPVNTFNATASSIINAGAKPIFIDVGLDYNIDAPSIEDRITDKTKAIVPVHLYGQPADMNEILRIARENDLRVFEDACQSHGAFYHGRRTGSLGHAAAFSFYPAKNLGAFGDGGIVTTNDKALARKISHMRNYGQESKNVHDYLGKNSRLDTIQAAILNVKLNYLDQWNNSRRASAEQLSQTLENLIDIPIVNEDSHHVYHLYVVRTTNSEKRDMLIERLKEKGIDTGIHYPYPLHLQGAFDYLGGKAGDFPRAEEYSQTILSLPMFPHMTNEEIKYIEDSIKGVLRK